MTFSLIKSRFKFYFNVIHDEMYLAFVLPFAESIKLIANKTSNK